MKFRVSNCIWGSKRAQFKVNVKVSKPQRDIAPVTKRSLDEFKGDPKWRELSKWGKELGVSSWTAAVVTMPAIHPYILMGSRLSVQNIIDGQGVQDQFGNVFTLQKNLFFLCAASGRTCDYCDATNKGTAFHLRDRDERDSVFLNGAIQAAQHLHAELRKKHYVLVHCHSGRNRSALVILVFCALYTNLSFNEAVRIIKDYNSSRFPRSSTLKNSSFSKIVQVNWDTIRSNKTVRHRWTAYGDF